MRKGCFPVDYETLESKRKAKGLSKEKLAKLAKVSVSVFNHWKKGVWAKPELLEAVAKVLGFQDYLPLVANDPPASHVGEPESQSTRMRDLVRKAFMSQGFAYWAVSQGGFDVADFAYYLRLAHYPELRKIRSSDDEKDEVLEEFCRAGLLERATIDKGPRQGAKIIRQRSWTPRQLADAMHLRITVEKEAARRAVKLRASENQQCQDEYFKIRDTLHTLLHDMATADQDLLSDQSDEAARHLIDLDTRFHMTWAGTSTSYILSLEVVMQEIRQVIDLFVYALHQAQEAGKPLPDGMPTLAELTGDFYHEISELYKAFLVAAPDDEDSLSELDRAIEEHANAGYGVLEKAQQLLEHVRGF